MPHRLRSAAFAALFPLAALAASGIAAPAAADPACNDAGIVTKQIECFLAAAEAAGDPGVCRQAEEVSVRFNCISVYAERTEDPAACTEIAEQGTEGQAMRDACLGGVALVTGNPELCAAAELPALRDACYLTLVLDHGGDPALCAEISLPALQEACRDGT